MAAAIPEKEESRTLVLSRLPEDPENKYLILNILKL